MRRAPALKKRIAGFTIEFVKAVARINENLVYHEDIYGDGDEAERLWHKLYYISGKYDLSFDFSGRGSLIFYDDTCTKIHSLLNYEFYDGGRRDSPIVIHMDERHVKFGREEEYKGDSLCDKLSYRLRGLLNAPEDGWCVVDMEYTDTRDVIQNSEAVKTIAEELKRRSAYLWEYDLISDAVYQAMKASDVPKFWQGFLFVGGKRENAVSFAEGLAAKCKDIKTDGDCRFAFSPYEEEKSADSINKIRLDFHSMQDYEYFIAGEKIE